MSRNWGQRIPENSTTTTRAAMKAGLKPYQLKKLIDVGAVFPWRCKDGNTYVSNCIIPDLGRLWSLYEHGQLEEAL